MTSPTFELHPRLEADTVFVADWTLCRVLLMNDARFFWLVLIPRRHGLHELHDLTLEDATLLTCELVRAGRNLKTIAAATKINTGALGNLVPQLHVHVVARVPADAAWPGPVWGCGAAVPYEPAARDALLARLRREL